MSEQKALWWQNLPADEIVRHAKEVCDIAILPIGAIEQHGPHCPCGDDDFNAIGMAELCLDLMVARSRERKTFGKYLHQHGPVAEWIARSRIEIEQARLLVLKTAALIDQGGAKAARKEISMIKVIAPTLLTTIADRAIQVFGAMGLSPDTPLADLYTGGRTLRFADGPDEVHLQTIARLELREQEDKLARLMKYLEPLDTGRTGDH